MKITEKIRLKRAMRANTKECSMIANGNYSSEEEKQEAVVLLDKKFADYWQLFDQYYGI